MRFESFVICALLLAPSSNGFLVTDGPTPRTSLSLLASAEDGTVVTTTTTTTTTSSNSNPSTSLMTGVVNAKVDMNQYNLDPEQIPEQWTAKLQAATEMEEAGVFLGAQDSKNNFVDTIKVIVPCPAPGNGLGIELLELAGGRADGLGITIVSGLVPGKAAESSGLIFGDSITQLSLRRKKMNSNDIEEIFTASTECLDYDGTIDGILSVLGTAAEEQGNGELILVFTAKRLRRKPKVKMLLQYPPEMQEPDVSLELFAGENLRRAMLVRGVKLNDPLARRFDNGGSGDCGAEGTCATCAVSVTRGLELLNPPKQQEEQMLQRNPRWRMACRAIVGYGMREGDLILRLSPRQWAEK